MDRCGSGFNHALHQLKCVQRAPKTGFCVGNNGKHPVHVVLAFSVRNLVGAHECVVDRAHYGGNAVGRIEALIRIHVSAEIGVGSYLPAAKVNGLHASRGHLYGLVAGESAKRGNVRFAMEQAPELLGARAGK